MKVLYYGDILFLFLISICNIELPEFASKRWVSIGFGIYVLIILLIFPYRIPRTYINEVVFDEAKRIAEELDAKLLSSANKPLNVFLVCDGWEEPLIQQRTYYNLIGKVKIKNYSNQGWIVSETYSVKYFREQEAKQQLDNLEKILLVGDYIYICKAEEKFIELCKDFFGAQANDHALHQIKAIEGDLTIGVVERR